MKRVVVDRYGGPEVLRVVEDDDPRPGPGEVRVRVLAAGVSFTDAQLRAGTYLGVPKPPFTPGYELVGVVEELGPGCSRLRAGDRVAALTVWGAYAERVCVREVDAVEVPGELDPAEVVSLVLPYMTAYQLLHRTARVKSGETVLVHGAAGRVGTAVLELGVLAALRLYGTASARDRAVVERLGAVAIDYRNEDSWPGCASSPATAWTWCSTGSVARCRFAPSARCGRADGWSCSATTPCSRTGARAGADGSSGTRRPSASRSGGGSRPAGGWPPTISRSCAKAARCCPWGDVAEGFLWVEARATPSGSGRTSWRCSSCLVRTRSTRSWPSACRWLMRAARMSCWRSRRLWGDSFSCHEPTRTLADGARAPCSARGAGRVR
jgi:Alcohol dehydrogenase GroES-like domain